MVAEEVASVVEEAASAVEEAAVEVSMKTKLESKELLADSPELERCSDIFLFPINHLLKKKRKSTC